MRQFIASLGIVAMSFGLAGCSSNPFTGESQLSDTAIGAGTGAAVGAGAGYAVGSVTHIDPATSTLVGAGVGAASGAAAGLYLDNQNAQKRAALQSSGVSVTRAGNSITLNLDKELSFEKGQSTLSPANARTLDSVAMVLRKYPNTRLDVIGYADLFEGTALSKQRAEVVTSYLAGQGIAPTRLTAVGTSSMFASNSRRVDMNLQPLS